MLKKRNNMFICKLVNIPKQHFNFAYSAQSKQRQIMKLIQKIKYIMRCNPKSGC